MIEYWRRRGDRRSAPRGKEFRRGRILTSRLWLRRRRSFVKRLIDR